ncbi:CheR family methyltransferase [Paenibacillus marinisediminis]
MDMGDLNSQAISYTEEETRDYIQFIDRVKRKSGIDLAQYKEAQMRRRLNTLRTKNGYDSFASFYHAMEEDKHLFYEFLDRMTINVSEFWRNPSRWEVLRTKVLPELLSHSSRLRCWSAACSTGEEPYTLAMILDDLNVFTGSKLLASDLDDNALARAKEGIYISRALKDVPSSFQSRFFTQENELFRIHDRLKSGISFQKQNLLNDRFDTGFDLIICRNVMIYFTEEAKHMLYHKFAQSLRPGGVLFVGSTEQIFNPGQYGLETVETFFYRKLT